MSQRAGLLVHFDVVIEVDRQRADKASASGDFVHMAVAHGFGQGHVARSNSPQQIGLQCGVWNQAGEAAVNSVKIVPFNMVIDLAIYGINYRCREDADVDTRVMKIQPYCVERTPHVEPIGRSDDPFVTETEHLASADEIEPAFGRAAQLQIRLPNVPDVLVGRRGGDVVIEKDP
jgi:hypothetical protein